MLGRNYQTQTTSQIDVTIYRYPDGTFRQETNPPVGNDNIPLSEYRAYDENPTIRYLDPYGVSYSLEDREEKEKETKKENEGFKLAKQKKPLKKRAILEYFNIFIFIVSLIVLMYGLAVHLEGASSFEESKFDPIDRYTVNLIVIIPLTYLTTSFFGACASYSMNNILLILNFALFYAIMSLKIFGHFLYHLFQDILKAQARATLKSFAASSTATTMTNATLNSSLSTKPEISGFGPIEERNESSWSALGVSWKGIQKVFDCCGMEGYSDWVNAGVPNPPAPCNANKTYPGCEEATAPYISTLISISYLLIFVDISAMLVASYYIYQLVSNPGTKIQSKKEKEDN